MIGRKLSHYTVTAKLGAGGMGEVYRARDGKLDRDVALKVLPEAFTADPERLARFEREAKVLASLNHPGIAQIYGIEEADGIRALALELVEGPTLAERIGRGRLPLDEALEIARQIADALEAAHRQGVIHRDLKPANVKVRDDGTVKVLDFGLARALEPAREASPLSTRMPTLTSPAMTLAGMILGTAAYMSPEQARGLAVDRRADVWAFGCVLFEMLTGRRAFEGEDLTLTLAEVMKTEPNWATLPPATPAGVRRVLECCLEKDPKKRLRDIGDMGLILDFAARGDTVEKAGPTRRWGWIVAAALGGLLVGGGITWRISGTPRSPERKPVRLAVRPPEGVSLGLYGIHNMALSSDSRTLVFLGRRGGSSRLYRRDMDSLEVSEIPGTEGAINPFLSPDDLHVGFARHTTLARVALNGGPAVAMARVGAVPTVTWATEESIVYAVDGGLWQVPAAGGDPEPVQGTDPDAFYVWPDALPDGRSVLVTDRRAAFDEPQVAVVSLETGEATRLLTGIYPKYLASGHLVYWRDGVVWAVRFDAANRRPRGAPVAVVEGVSRGKVVPAFAVGRGGSLAVARGSNGWVLAWMRADGSHEPALAVPDEYHDPRLSPGGDRLALSRVMSDQTTSNQDVWLYDLDRGTELRVTEQPGQDMAPIWDSSGQSLTFTEGTLTGSSLVQVPIAPGADTEPRPLLELPGDAFPASWSAEGRFLAFVTGGQGDHLVDQSFDADIWVYEEGEQPRPFLDTDFFESDPEISPDGQRIAYTSDRSGELQVYVAPFPAGGAAIPVSTTGGFWPVWSRRGDHLYYRTDTHLMRTGAGRDGSFGVPQPLFEAPVIGGFMRGYDVAPDGERFLMPLPMEGAEGPPQEIEVVLNWSEEIRRRLAAD